MIARRLETAAPGENESVNLPLLRSYSFTEGRLRDCSGIPGRSFQPMLILLLMLAPPVAGAGLGESVKSDSGVRVEIGSPSGGAKIENDVD